MFSRAWTAVTRPVNYSSDPVWVSLMGEVTGIMTALVGVGMKSQPLAFAGGMILVLSLFAERVNSALDPVPEGSPTIFAATAQHIADQSQYPNEAVYASLNAS